MKTIHLARFEPNRAGGGWSFMSNLASYLGQTDYEQAEVYMICGATMVQREEVYKAKADGKKIVLRIDNAVRNSRNRNTGMSRMRSFAEIADLVIYQSQWARDYLSRFLFRDGPVILNGTDLDTFKGEAKIPYTYLYSRQNRDETKNWEVARYWFSWCPPPAKLYIVGNFSDELRQGNFDFYQNEVYEYLPTLSKHNYAKILNQVENFIYTYYNDACSNSLIEALAANCKIVGPQYFLTTGGAPEIMSAFEVYGRDYFSIERMGKQYEEAINGL